MNVDNNRGRIYDMTRYIDLVNDVFARDRLNRYSSFCWLLSVRRLFSKRGKILQGKGVKSFKTPEKKVFLSIKNSKNILFGADQGSPGKWERAPCPSPDAHVLAQKQCSEQYFILQIFVYLGDILFPNQSVA